jgi:hypothetical protein
MFYEDLALRIVYNPKGTFTPSDIIIGCTNNTRVVIHVFHTIIDPIEMQFRLSKICMKVKWFPVNRAYTSFQTGETLRND